MKKVLKAQINAAQKQITGGCTIEFESVENIMLETIVSLKVNERIYDFNVNGVSVTENSSLMVRATEVGYWGAKIDRQKDFDIRNLIGAEVEVVTDIEVIKKIRQSSQYC